MHSKKILLCFGSDCDWFSPLQYSICQYLHQKIPRGKNEVWAGWNIKFFQEYLQHARLLWTCSTDSPIQIIILLNTGFRLHLPPVATQHPSFNMLFHSWFKFIKARAAFCATAYWVHESTHFEDTEIEINNCHTINLLFLYLLSCYKSRGLFIDFPKCLHSQISIYISSKKVIISSLRCELLYE